MAAAEDERESQILAKSETGAKKGGDIVAEKISEKGKHAWDHIEKFGKGKGGRGKQEGLSYYADLHNYKSKQVVEQWYKAYEVLLKTSKLFGSLSPTILFEISKAPEEAWQLKETPEKSNRLIASIFGVDDKTVGSVRKELEVTAEIPQLETSIGADGKERPREVKPKQEAPLFSKGSKETQQTCHEAGYICVSGV